MVRKEISAGKLSVKLSQNEVHWRTVNNEPYVSRKYAKSTG
jgi:hypothetical protein